MEPKATGGNAEHRLRIASLKINKILSKTLKQKSLFNSIGGIMYFFK
jgi:hypothetical protein